MDLILIISGAILLLAGLAGCLLPFLPGILMKLAVSIMLTYHFIINLAAL